MKLIIRLFFSTLAVLIAAYLVSGVFVNSIWAAFAFAIILGIVNLLIRPFILILTLSINLLTLGLFTLVINALMVELAAVIVPGFQIFGFWHAVLFALVLWIVKWSFDKSLNLKQ